MTLRLARIGRLPLRPRLASVSGRPGTPPAALSRVILFTDPGQDVDDSAALALLTTLKEQGLIDVAGVVTSTNTERAAATARLHLDYAGLRDVPVASYKGSALPQTDYYTSGLATSFGYSQARSSFADPVTLVRTLLRDSPDGSVILCGVGPLLDFAAVMASPGDGIDVRTGLELITAKCSRGIVMGGTFNNAQSVSGGTEFNFQNDPTRAAYVMDNWPAPLDLWLVDFNLGQSIPIGPLDTASPTTNPLKRAYDLFQAGNGSAINVSGGRKRRSAFDPIAVDLVLGLGERWSQSRGTNAVNTATGANTFTKGAGRHLYTVAAKPLTTIQAELEAYLDASDTGAAVLPAVTITGITPGPNANMVVAHTTNPKATGYEVSLDNGVTWATLPASKIPTGTSGETTYPVRVRAMRYVTPGTPSAAVSGTTSAAVAFNPTQLYTGGGDGVFIGVDPANLRLDIAGTQPAVVDQPVGRILDLSGNNIHAVALSDADRWILRQDAGTGRYYLEGTGTQRGYTIGTGADLNFAQVSMIMAVRAANLGVQYQTLGGKPHTTTHSDPFFRFGLLIENTDRIVWRLAALSRSTPAGQGLNNVPRVITMLSEPGIVRKDGAVIQDDTDTPTISYPNAIPFRLFSNASGQETFRGRFTGAILINRTLSSAELAQAEAYLAALAA